ncbi:MAG: very short patch repair endonuclease [Eubacteriales bacterium]|nr:very short patch repair endonuclease [Eubacteriales bacterium]
MADVHSPEIRSFNMSRIHGKGTKPEERVRKYLFSQGFRYRKNDNRLPGTPDIVLPKYRSVVFINGCFWHKHEGCKYFVWPKSNVDFWQNKINSNVERDNRQHKELESLGWNVIVIWECELKHNFDETMNRLIEQLKKQFETIH